MKRKKTKKMTRRKNGEEDSTALIILLKNAKKGHAKTRLAAGIGVDAAHDAYLHLLSCTQQLVEATHFTVYLYYSESLPEVSARWQMQNGNYRLQSDGDLGNRMLTAFTEVLAHHDRAIIMGSDCPYITQGHLDQASDLLKANDVVYGPSLDGGYYLLGMKSPHQTLFTEIPWSTEEVLDKSLAQCKAAQLSVSLLEPLEDIDDAEGWERYQATLSR